jgi:hypothetical protein
MSYRQWEIEPDQISQDQRACLAYWESLPKQPPHDIPHQGAFQLFGLPPASLPTTHIVDIIDDGQDYKYRFWGSGFRDYLGYDGTGISTADLKPDEIAIPVREAYRLVMEKARPVAMISEFQRGTTAPIRGFQTFIRLPLANDDGVVSQIVSVVEFQMNNLEVLKLIADTSPS